VEGGLPAVDEYSAPVFWTTVGTSSLDIVTIVNGLPDRVGQTPFVSGAEALNWVASSSNYFAVGPDYYEQIDADRLGLYLDANQVISYPTTQSTWYDLSGQSQNFTLYNGVKWQNDGWFEFDQTDDYMLNTTIPYQSSSGTIIVTCYPNSGLDNDYIAGVGNAGTIGGSRAIGIISNRWWLVGYGSSPQDFTTGFVVNYNRWSHVAYIWDNTTSVTASVNGQFESTTKTLVTPTGTYFRIGDPPWGGGYGWWGGLLAKVQFYPKALTEAEMRQNYYGGPIVTDSLVFALDAGNLVSYPKSGTAVYTLTGSINGTLTNGTGFSPNDGGYWIFDGSDDYILLGSSITPGNGNWTLSAWVKGFGGVVGNTSGGPVASGFGIFSTGGNYKIFYANYDGSWNYHYGNTTLDPNTWYFLTWVNYSSQEMKMYVNASPDSSVFNSLTTNGGPVDAVGGTQGTPGGTFNGNIASVYWNIGKAFTDDEVLQQYNATK
jgi:hypothetical protein